MVKIESYDKTIKDLFNDFYTVPDFQREYVWGDTQVTQLLEDIYGEYTGEGSESEYFVGSIVVCKNADGNWAVVDGQQRVTTLFIIFCAIKDKLAELNPNADLSGVKQLLAGTDINIHGRTEHNLRLQLQYEDSGNILRRLQEKNIDETDAKTESMKNILLAYKIAYQFISSNFETENELSRFFAYIIRNVKVIRVETKDIAHALKVFETVNDRGVGLTPMDLLKNLMFIKTDKEEYPALKNDWKEITFALEKVNEKPLRFLRYFILATYDTGIDKKSNTRIIREDEIYDWFKENEEQCGHSKNPRQFVKFLKNAVDNYVSFIEGKNIDNSPNYYLMNLNRLSGVARQHVILLLAGRHLNKDNFAKLSNLIENLFFLYIITRQATKEFERNFTRWAKELRKTNDGNINDFFEKRLVAEINSKAENFETTFEFMSELLTQNYRVRYILAKLAQYIDQQARGVQPDNLDISNYINNEVDVEHIYPLNPKKLPAEFKDNMDYLGFKHKLANLTLLEKTINTSISNESYERKKPGYARSKFLLTQSIAQDISFGKNTRMSRISRLLEQYPDWNKQSILDRQKLLTKIALRVWCNKETDN